MRTQAEKATAFRALHERSSAFVIPNPWDLGTAKLLVAIGFEALATTSLGLANMLGRADSHVTRAEVLDNCRVIAQGTDLPVNVDLENGFAHDPAADPRRSDLPQEPVRSVALSRITQAIRPARSTNSTSLLLVCARRPKSHARFRCHSC